MRGLPVMICPSWHSGRFFSTPAATWWRAPWRSATRAAWREYRRKDDFAPGCWVQADAGHVYAAHQRGLVVRALFETPRVIQPEKLHEFRGRVCVRCGDSEDWAGPDCEPLIQKVDPRTRLPVEASWILEPLKWIRDAGPAPVSTHERRRRATEATFLIEKLEAHIEECNKP